MLEMSKIRNAREWPPCLLLQSLVIALLLTGAVQGQKFSFGKCPTVTPVTSFSSSLLTGTWYEYGRTPTLNEHSLRCVSFTFTPNTALTMFGIRLQGTKAISLTTGTTTAYGTATFPSGITTAAFRVVFPTALSALGGGKSTNTYYIVASDGSVAMMTTTPATYLVLYSCRNFGLGRMVNVIFLTSTQTPSQAVIDALNQNIANLGVQSSWVKITDQDSC